MQYHYPLHSFNFVIIIVVPKFTNNPFIFILSKFTTPPSPPPPPLFLSPSVFLFYRMFQAPKNSDSNEAYKTKLNFKLTMNLSFGNCDGKRLSEKAGMGNWGTE